MNRPISFPGAGEGRLDSLHTGVGGWERAQGAGSDAHQPTTPPDTGHWLQLVVRSTSLGKLLGPGEGGAESVEGQMVRGLAV